MVHTLVATALTQPSTTTYTFQENITSLSVCVSCMSDPPIALISVMLVIAAQISAIGSLVTWKMSLCNLRYALMLLKASSMGM